jgi:3-isopropylmalate dehydratase small subunit
MVSGMTSPPVEPLPTLEGRAWNLGLELDAAQILEPHQVRSGSSPSQHALFATVAPDLARSLGPDDVIIAERMVGTTEAAEPALLALASTGVRILVAGAFDPAFRAVCDAYGIASVVVDTPSSLHTHDRLRLDFDAEKIVNLSSGDRVPMRNLDTAARAALRALLAATHLG